MSYRVEKEDGRDGRTIIIDGFEKGIADSPYTGIANMRNLNVKYYPGVAYGNYKRQPATLSWGAFTLTGSLSPGATTATLNAVWPYVSGTYPVTFSSAEVKNVVFTNGSAGLSWTGGLVNSATTAITVGGAVIGRIRFSCVGDTGIKYIIDDLGQIWKQIALNTSSFTIIQNSPTVGAGGQGIAFWNNYLVVFRLNFIDFCGNGTGDSAVTSSNWVSSTGQSAIGNISNLVLAGTVSAGAVSATISTYTDAGGNNRTTTWFGATGTYQLVLSSSGETIPVSLTNGSGTVTFAYPAQIGGTASGNKINILVGGNQMTLIPRRDANLYFTNGNGVGSIGLPLGISFNPVNIPTTNGTSYTITYRAVGIPTLDTAIWLDELQKDMIISGKNTLYPWSFAGTVIDGVPIPIPEQISKTINILNNIYVFAGFKGNIYLSNGSSAQPFKKMPDYIANNSAISVNDKFAPIDPQWLWGGVMSHRLRLFFQALAIDSATGTTLVSGIFSLGLVSGNGLTLETPGNLVMENQNSYGLVQSSTAAAGILIDNSNSGITYDSYYSAWTSGLGDVGGIDFNDTTLYSNNEMIIETDLIPIGTFDNKASYSNLEFKFDEPMKSGDSITVYARRSLSDSYVLVGTTTDSVLSDMYSPISDQEYQWLQFMITMSCNSSATSSSFNRLREIRLRK